MPRSSFLLILAAFTICLWACGPNSDALNAELTLEEASMPEAKYYSDDFIPVPDEVMDGLALGSVPEDKTLPFDEINSMTQPGYLELENGYSLLEDGTAYVAVRTDFPGATGEMIYWWFRWHAMKDIRYKIWCPGAHYAISVEDMDQLTNERLSDKQSFLRNPQYPVEDIGPGPMTLSIRFVPPEQFGFKPATFRKNGVAAVICGVVGFRAGQMTIEHTNMCHVFRKKGDGLELRSRFWLGKRLNTPNLKKLIITEDLAMDMFLHCSQEFNHLAGFLPDIYNEFADKR